MSQQPDSGEPQHDQGGTGEGQVDQNAPPDQDAQPDQEAPRVGPRPLERPVVDPDQAAAFARPSGVDSAFAPGPGQQDAESGPVRLAPPAPEALATAFGRPAGSGEQLQRPPDGVAPNGEPEPEDPFWSDSSGADPWRDPGAGAVLGPPAVRDAPSTGTPARQSAELLSLPEVLFGRRVKPVALIALGLAALLVGAVGGLAGWLTGFGGGSLTSGGTTIAQAEPGKERAPGSVAAVAQRVAPAVVSLEVQAGQSGGVGSGVVIDKSGYVITNNHVVAPAVGSDAGKITAVFTDGSRADAKIVGTDPKTDLAVVKVNVRNPTVITAGSADSLAVGDTVLAIGSPLGLQSTVTEGIVSALHRPLAAAGENGEDQVVYDAIQTDAAINRGNSGGALVDSSGALVGINSVISTSGAEGGNIGLGFAIPVDEAVRIAQALIRDGKVNHASMGVNVKSVSANSSQGAQVQNVRQGSAAQRAGIVEGDVITRVGNRAISDASEFEVAVRERSIGEKVPVRLVRRGAEQTVDVTLQSD
jgi:S1-C subfamily serine protease